MSFPNRHIPTELRPVRLSPPEVGTQAFSTLVPREMEGAGREEPPSRPRASISVSFLPSPGAPVLPPAMRHAVPGWSPVMPAPSHRAARANSAGANASRWINECARKTSSTSERTGFRAPHDRSREARSGSMDRQTHSPRRARLGTGPHPAEPERRRRYRAGEGNRFRPRREALPEPPQPRAGARPWQGRGRVSDSLRRHRFHRRLSH